MPDLEPITRKETLLDGGDLTPITRKEMFIKRIYDKNQSVPEPITREEYFLAKAGEGSGGDVTIEQLNVTENGTYSESGKAYSPVVVNVPTPPIPENAYLLNNLSGLPADIASFNDGTDLPMASLKVTVTPYQDLSHGDPSPENICPIIGWDEAVVTRTGKNLWGGLPLAQDIEQFANNPTLDTTNKTLIFTNAKLIDGSYSHPISNGISYKENTQYTFILAYKNNGKNNCLVVRYMDNTFESIELTNSSGSKTLKVFTTAQNKTVKEIILAYYANAQTYLYYEESGLFGGVITASDFEPYNGATYTIDLDGTRYGSVVDATNGTMDDTLDHIASYNGEALPSTWISDRDVYAEGTTPTIGAEVVYTRATPITVQLAPTQVKSLIGSNNIFADCGDIIELEYFSKEV